jgi:hypothetical protein
VELNSNLAVLIHNVQLFAIEISKVFFFFFFLFAQQVNFQASRSISVYEGRNHILHAYKESQRSTQEVDVAKSYLISQELVFKQMLYRRKGHINFHL